MHPNPEFRKTETAASIRAARNRGFGMLVLNGDAVPMCSHIPFLLSPDGTSAETHIVRSNPIARRLSETPIPALLSVVTADAYISPDWYGIADQVPTWNYVAVHLTGHLTARPTEDLPGHLNALSDFFESRLLPKPVWKLSKVDPEIRARLMRMILPVRLKIDQIDATWKLSQNKIDTARLAAAKALAAQDGANALAQMMQDLPAQNDGSV